jgi:FdhD protein
MGSLTNDLLTRSSIPCNVKEWRNGDERSKIDYIAREVPVALVYNGISHAVMMASPSDLEEFAVGFSFTEGLIESVADIYDIELVIQPDGIELAIEISAQKFNQLKNKRRTLAGRTGCGICGRESLQQMAVDVEPVTPVYPDPNAINRAVEAIEAHQPLQLIAGGVHGAAWCDNEGSIQFLLEDIGRHNALDKLIGYRLVNRCDFSGFVLVSSRASYEMVQKSATAGFGALVSLSAATSEAVALAQKSRMTLVGFARPGRHLKYT